MTIFSTKKKITIEKKIIIWESQGSNCSPPPIPRGYGPDIFFFFNFLKKNIANPIAQFFFISLLQSYSGDSELWCSAMGWQWAMTFCHGVTVSYDILTWGDSELWRSAMGWQWAMTFCHGVTVSYDILPWGDSELWCSAMGWQWAMMFCHGVTVSYDVLPWGDSELWHSAMGWQWAMMFSHGVTIQISDIALTQLPFTMLVLWSYCKPWFCNISKTVVGKSYGRCMRSYNFTMIAVKLTSF